jgi:predicted secreted Zn-dependent protease
MHTNILSASPKGAALTSALALACLKLSAAEFIGPPAPQTNNIQGAGLILKGEPGKPAIMTWVSPTPELQRSAGTMSLSEAKSLLSLSNVTVAHFEVFGNTAMEALQSARQRGYFDTTTQGIGLKDRPAGHTSWRLEWEFIKDKDGRELVNKLKISWAAIVLLPRWAGPATNANVVVDRPHEMQVWQDFYDSLWIHEAHHVQGPAKKIEEFKLRYAEVLKRPGVTPQEVRAELIKVLDQINAHDREIDVRFKHQ